MNQPNRHSISVAAVITNEDGNVVVIKRRDNGAWQLPGGILELNETIEDGVIREVREETGVDVKPIRLTGIYKNMNLGVVALVLRAELTAGQPHPTDESAEVAWWTPEQVTTGQSQAFGVRILDALRDTHIPAIRHHDGTNLIADQYCSQYALALLKDLVLAYAKDGLR